jgi:hypothetical protein
MAVVFPHLDEIQRAQDKRFEKQLVSQNSGESGRHEGLAKTDNICTRRSKNRPCDAALAE